MGPPPATAASADDELLALRSGDRRAFLELVRRLHPSMMRIASLYVSNPALAEEVVQEAWLGVLRGLGAFEGRSSLRGWIFSIVANCARTRGSREARQVPFSALAAEDDEGGPTVAPERFHGPDHPRWAGHWASAPQAWSEERLLQAESCRVAQRAIAELPPRQREVITLRDVEGMESDEVCDLLGLSEANQRVLLHRARAKVRAALDAYLAADGPRAEERK
jgi:RNA polymerase sigma-70 factor (ECF subfamily)